MSAITPWMESRIRGLKPAEREVFQALLAACEEHPEGISSARLAERLGKSATRVRSLLRVLEAAGLVEKHERTGYRFPGSEAVLYRVRKVERADNGDG